ncbi:2644_t:CDS:2 [Acaulospora colombiana]|uniref:2644_t:CDS:1 n=1 Tax=Acaulospora colombiana TaxID=27376 RepID=A0ACA9L9R6_9GLOM|nr:2644_t:CDS:2 [Acaulospora colombiana]
MKKKAFMRSSKELLDISKANVINAKMSVLQYIRDFLGFLLRVFPEFQQHWYVESQLHQPEEVRRLLCDDNYVKTLLPAFLKDMKTYHQKFGATFELVFFSQECLGYDSNHAKMRYELYSLALKKPGLGESYFIQKLVDDLVSMDFKDLEALLRTWIDYLEDVSNALGIMSQECQEVIEFLNQLEVLTPKPRQAIHTALGLPTDYIKCNCCDIDENDSEYLDSREQILSTHPDTSILYKLHLQCGKLINIYDWLESFESVISRDNLENGKIDDKEVR